jgi:hypothetical protein
VYSVMSLRIPGLCPIKDLEDVCDGRSTVGSSELQPETVIKWDMCNPVLTETRRLPHDVISVHTPIEFPY